MEIKRIQLRQKVPTLKKILNYSWKVREKDSKTIQTTTKK